MAYADDVAIITENQIQLQDAINRWQEGIKKYGLKINVNKTEIMNVNRHSQEYNIYIDQQQLKQVTQFGYLGVLFTQDNTQNRAIAERIQKFNANLNMLYPLLKDKNIPIHCKTTIYNTILKPILLYGSETWTMTKNFISKVNSAEMKVLRIIKGVTRKDKIRNTKIREELKIEPVEEIISRNSLRWYGHIKRMEEDRYPLKYLEWKPEGRKPPERPRKRWLDGIKKNLRDRNIVLEEVKRQKLYEDRDRWRILKARPTTDR